MVDIFRNNMNCTKESNVFNEVPVYEASKGEPGIVKALRRLRDKVHCIDQVRQNENPLKSFKDINILDEEDLTLNEVQYHLGMLQIQFVRSLLKKESNGSFKNPVHEKTKDRCMSASECRSNNFYDYAEQVIIEDKETQTGNSFMEMYMSDSPLPDLQSKGNKTSRDLKVSASAQTVEDGEDTIDTASEKSKITKLSSQPHYHLKLDDVPFILGASSSASHSVVANLQNIIAMMKSHNKALCGPKPHTQQPSNHNQNKGDSLNSMLNEITEDLTNLNARHRKLKDQFDYAQQKDSYLRNKSNVADNPGSFSHAAETSKRPNRQKSQQKLTIPNIRTASSIPPLPARRKLLRSLQDFKTHLSEEDITWN